MSSSINSVVYKILTSRETLCCLCFGALGDAPINNQDDIALNWKNNTEMNSISAIITNVLDVDVQFQEDLEVLGSSFCDTCTKMALKCYNFIKTCRDNLKDLTSAINLLNDSFENTKDDVQTFKALFVSVDEAHSTIEHFYDTNRTEDCSEALKRFEHVSRMQKGNKRYQNSDKVLKGRRYKSCKDDKFLEICELVKDNDAPTKYKCKVCLSTFSKSYNFKKHYYSQHAPKVLQCPECSKSYGSEALLKQHKYDCHASVLCGYCGKTYANRYSLLYHLRHHTGETPYKCKYCNLQFRLSSRRAEHIRRKHLEPAEECDICHSKFKALSSLYNHRKRHFNPNSRLHVTVNSHEEVIEESLVTEEPTATEWVVHVDI